MKYEINSNYLNSEEFLKDCVINFDTKGEAFGDQKRNSLKLFHFDDLVINIKSFRVPNFINQIVYRFFRKSKSQRSFEYARKLEKFNIGTPEPIAYFEFPSLFLFKSSFYLSKQLNCDLTYRELNHNFDYPDHEIILRAFTRFTYTLHEKGINFLDHSPGNTLIKKVDNGYEFYLVDLNRMKFGSMNFEVRMKNFARLTKHENMVQVMSDEYAKISSKSYSEVFESMWEYTREFRKKIENKKKIKKKVKFWKK